MSLVNPLEMSAASYGNTSSGIRQLYLDESFDIESLLDSPSEELVYPSSSGSLGNHFPSHDVSLREYQTNSESDYLTSQSPGTPEFDDAKIRTKLQELEHVLLDDIDENLAIFGSDNSMEIDSEWARPLQDSDSPSTDSNTSSVPLKQSLFECALAISEGSLEEASNMITELRQMVSLQGEPSQRIAAYMVEGLAARLESSGKFLYKALKCKEPPSSDRLAAMQVLFEGCPCFKFGFMAANGAIMEAMRGEKAVHLVDFDVSQGNQYVTLIQSLANQPATSKSPPRIRLTGIDNPESIQRPAGGLASVGRRLEKLAEFLGVSFEFRSIATSASAVALSMLASHPGEALIVNFAFQLHHMPDESVSMVNERDRLLRMVKDSNPKLVTVVEQDVNTNTAPFLQRFSEAYSYYSAVFESLDATFSRESQDRVNVEKQCLARDIVNIVACEGEERIERYEVAGKWRARMSMAGFRPRPMSRLVCDAVGRLIKGYSQRYKVKEEMGALCFGWEDKNLIVTSAWS
nr:GRAS transcription factor 20 [Rheum palmatum]